MILATTEGRKWNSSLIKYTEYVPDTNQLTVTFSNDKVYIYEEITEKDYQDFCNAESQGSFFAKNFRTKKFTKVETDEKDGDTQSN